jgi:hypothetical protein
MIQNTIRWSSEHRTEKHWLWQSLLHGALSNLGMEGRWRGRSYNLCVVRYLPDQPYLNPSLLARGCLQGKCPWTTSTSSTALRSRPHRFSNFASNSNIQANYVKGDLLWRTTLLHNMKRHPTNWPYDVAKSCVGQSTRNSSKTET